MSVEPSPPPPPKRGQPLLAWLVILGVVAFILFWPGRRKAAQEDDAWLAPLLQQSRYLVGVSQLKLPGASGQQFYDQARNNLAANGYSQRLRLAILGGELVGPKAALDELASLDKDHRDDDSVRDISREACRLLIRLYTGYETAPAIADLDAAEQAKLRDGLGWFGDLALTPAGADTAARAKVLAPAYRAFIVTASMGVLALLALVGGVALLAILGILAATRGFPPLLRASSGHGGLYAETFALYMALFVGLSYAVSWIPHDRAMMWPTAVVMVGSQLALLWPVARGLTWKQVRADVGLDFGGQPLVEVASGFACYLCAVPAFVAGLVCMFVLMALSRWLGYGDPPSPSHPIASEILGQGVWGWVQVYVLACVLAPITEEVMFRGVLYRHLREGSVGLGRFVSVAASVLVTAFVFAVIHPQGWLGVPPLMGLAVVFSLTREWRRSLVAPMVAHSVHNSVITAVLFLTVA